jgi:hypothetical protein
LQESRKQKKIGKRGRRLNRRRVGGRLRKKWVPVGGGFGCREAGAGSKALDSRDMDGCDWFWWEGADRGGRSVGWCSMRSDWPRLRKVDRTQFRGAGAGRASVGSACPHRRTLNEPGRWRRVSYSG